MEDAVQILQQSEDLVKLKIRKDEDNSGVCDLQSSLLSVCSERESQSLETCQERVKVVFHI